jgi:3'(2'), 5'-bisphosphate nucleotidase
MNANWMTTAIQAAHLAGRRILEIYATDFDVEQKSDHSPVTLADKQAHGIIQSALMPLGLPILSEEGRDIAHEQRKSWELFWLVDPLDGTKEFIKRNGEFTVNIALMAGDAPVAGVIYVPVRDCLYFGEKGMGAFKLNKAHPFIACWESDAVRPETLLETLLVVAVRLPNQTSSGRCRIVGSRSHSSQAMQDYVARLQSEKKAVAFMSAGSSLKFCLVAEGAADLYPRLAPTMEWDTAAGHAIAEAAGARVLQFESGEPLCYNKASLLNPWFVVDRGGSAGLPDKKNGLGDLPA